MAEEIANRKAEHIKICLEQNVQSKKVTTGFEDIQLIHRALPEINQQDINLSTSFLGKKFSAPLIVGAMTGGTEQATQINGAIAQAVENLGLGMGLGSQRAAITYRKFAKTYAIAREKAPNAFLIANIGGVQLTNGYNIKEVKQAVEMINADAVAFHLNAAQEAIQHRGQTNFKGVLAKIGEITRQLDTPVIVKETGCGISSEDAKKLEDAGVKAIDIAGLGGTSFPAVEYHRTKNNQDMGEVFRDWGIPTTISLVEVRKAVKIPIIASGGIRNGIEMVKAIALGANLTSISQPLLKAAIKSEKETEDSLRYLIDQFLIAMFLTGADSMEKLQKTPVLIMGRTFEWLTKRGLIQNE